MYKRNRNNWIKHIDFMLLDLVCLQLAYLFAFAVRFPGNGIAYSLTIYRDIIFVWSIILVACGLLLDSYRDVLRRGYAQELISVLSLDLVSFAVVIVYLFSTHVASVYSRILLYVTVGFFAVLDYLGRIGMKFLLRSYLQRKAGKSIHSRRVYVYSNADGYEEIIRNLEEDYLNDFVIEGLTIADALSAESVYRNIPVFPEDQAAEFICREWIDEVFVYLPGQSTTPEKFMKSCTEMGVTVHISMNLPSVDPKKEFIEILGDNTVLTVAYNYITPMQLFLKRSFDVLGGLVGSVFTVLIGLVIGPMIYFASPGPILFRQTRIGKNGKQFDVLKFRSMYPDAEERKKELLQQNRVSDGMMFKLDFDPRVIGNRILPDGTKKTGIGEFLRKTSLDEFPQFFNVLKGDMSLVGTRPPTVDEWEKYEYHHRARLAVKPGITGMWQVSGRSKITDFEEVVRLDTEYIANYRLSLDLKILLKTVKVVFERKGAM